MQQKTPHLTVNEQLIPAEAIQYELSRLVQFYSQHMPEAQVREQLPLLQQRAIDQAIGAKLLFDEAQRREIEVSDDEVEQQVQSMIERSGGREKFDELLQKQKTEEATLREQIRRGRRVDKLVEEVSAAAKEPVEADIRAHFDAHSQEYNRPERVLAQHILIKPADDSDESKEKARERLNKIRKQAQEGTKFSDLASDNSDCPSGREGGSLGWFSRGMMVPAFDKVVFDMQKGGLSDIIETQFGYHLIYKTDHEEAKPAEFDEARESVCDFLRHTRRGELLAKFVGELRGQAKVELDGKPLPAAK